MTDPSAAITAGLVLPLAMPGRLTSLQTPQGLTRQAQPAENGQQGLIGLLDSVAVAAIHKQDIDSGDPAVPPAYMVRAQDRHNHKATCLLSMPFGQHLCNPCHIDVGYQRMWHMGLHVLSGSLALYCNVVQGCLNWTARLYIYI